MLELLFKNPFLIAEVCKWDATILGRVSVASKLFATSNTRKMVEKAYFMRLHKAIGGKTWYRLGKIHKSDGPAVMYGDSSYEWYQNGKLHREDGPAVYWHNFKTAWYKNNKLHREDGPAEIWKNGRQTWYREGKLHRLDGPAIIDENGDFEYYIDNKSMSKEEYEKITM